MGCEAKKLWLDKRMPCWLIGVGGPYNCLPNCSHKLHMGVDCVGPFESQPHLIGLKSIVGVMLVFTLDKHTLRELITGLKILLICICMYVFFSCTESYWIKYI